MKWISCSQEVYTVSRLAELRAQTKEIEKTFASEFQKEKEGGGQKYTDDRFWKLTVDKAGNGSAEIRFLPGSDQDKLPYIKYWDHGFQGPTGRWYIEKSRTTLGPDNSDPVSELNGKMWNGNSPFDDPVEWPEKKRQDLVRRRKRRLHYVSNILVVDDHGNPENNGKVFLFDYGMKIFDKLSDVMPGGDQQSSGFDDPKFNPFDLDNGANFKLIAVQKDGFRNYDKSGFKAPAAAGDDESLEKMLAGIYHLGDLITPDKFKSYADLSMKLNSVLGDTTMPVSQATESQSAPAESVAETNNEAPTPVASSDDNDDGDEDTEELLQMFEDIASKNE